LLNWQFTKGVYTGDVYGILLAVTGKEYNHEELKGCVKLLDFLYMDYFGGDSRYEKRWQKVRI